MITSVEHQPVTDGRGQLLGLLRPLRGLAMTADSLGDITAPCAGDQGSVLALPRVATAGIDCCWSEREGWWWRGGGRGYWLVIPMTLAPNRRAMRQSTVGSRMAKIVASGSAIAPDGACTVT